jgi:hypothetical protein
MTRVPGYKTTEFWLTIASNLAALISTIAGTLPPKYGIPLMAGANALYSISRGLAKYEY